MRKKEPRKKTSKKVSIGKKKEKKNETAEPEENVSHKVDNTMGNIWKGRSKKPNVNSKEPGRKFEREKGKKQLPSQRAEGVWSGKIGGCRAVKKTTQRKFADTEC